MPWKERRAVCADLRQIYGADNIDGVGLALEFEEKWEQRYPMKGAAAVTMSPTVQPVTRNF